MSKITDVLRDLGISKVKLSKYLGVSRQMIYNYLEIEDLNKWPKDKKVLLLNLLNIKSVDDLNKIKVTTDYIMSVEARIENLFDKQQVETPATAESIFDGLNSKNTELLRNILNLVKEKLEYDTNDSYNSMKYLYYFLQSFDSTKENKYLLGYTSKMSGQIKPKEFAFDEGQQFIFESIIFSAMNLFNNSKPSMDRLTESHKRFVKKIEQLQEEKLSRTLEINSLKLQALKELGYSKITESNMTEVLLKIDELESRQKK